MVINSMLKNVASEAKTRREKQKKGVYTQVHEHFSGFRNAGWASVVVFQHTAKALG